MTKERLKTIYNILNKNNYQSVYLNLEIEDIEVIGIKVDCRISIEDREKLKRKLGNIDFFELRAEDDKEYLITYIGRKIRINFDGTFIIDDNELNIKNDEELEIKDYGYIYNLDEWFE